jgi:formylglycine-generating enzyme required for sulfatase activity
MNHTMSVLLLLLLAAPLRAQYIGNGGSELLNYIRSETADPACGVCLNAARKHVAEREKAELAKKTTGMSMIPAGKYLLGSPEGVGDPDEAPAAEILLDGFYLDRTEVTLDDYQAFVKATGGNHPEWLKPGGKFNYLTGSESYYKPMAAIITGCGKCPVFGVTREQAEAYCASRGKRLPTEAEWEAAARAGSAEKYSFGNSSAAAAEYAWFEDNSGERPRPVGTKKTNKLGLHDMHGNVWEWTADIYVSGAYAGRPRRNPPPQKGSGGESVIRGGSWAFNADSLRSGNRASTRKPNDDIGFRCAVSESFIKNWRRAHEEK